MKQFITFILCLLSFSLAIGQGSSLTKKERKEISTVFGGEPMPNQVTLPKSNEFSEGLLKEGDQLFQIIQGGEVSGYMLRTSAKGRFDYFDYNISYTPKLEVKGLLVTVYRSTHGAAICQKKWLSQFEGYAGGKLVLGKEIDAISGASFSAQSMVVDIQRCHALMTELQAGGHIH